MTNRRKVTTKIKAPVIKKIDIINNDGVHEMDSNLIKIIVIGETTQIITKRSMVDI